MTYKDFYISVSICADETNPIQSTCHISYLRDIFAFWHHLRHTYCFPARLYLLTARLTHLLPLIYLFHQRARDVWVTLFIAILPTFSHHCCWLNVKKICCALLLFQSTFQHIYTIYTLSYFTLFRHSPSRFSCRWHKKCIKYWLDVALSSPVVAASM